MVINRIKYFLKYRGTMVSPFSFLSSVQLGENVGIRPLVKMERCSIGKCSSMGTLSAAYDSEIGNFCSIGRECYIGGAKHPLDRVSSSCCFYLKENYTGKCYYENDYDWRTHTVIGNDVWLGARVIVMGGVTISDGAVIGAGSIVTKDVGPYEVWAGNPAKFIKKRFDDETIDKILRSQWWNWSDERLEREGHMFINVEKFINEIEG